ncbi:TA system VapC family ribonuclease toxin [Rhizobacter sp. OV335]|uniref:TA system VapC family ribonuclease toxin n=1 Tax=Rhizobacter sp. OV335 TaxID=1500264 RepID=UPI0009145941|nr:TA system VapC family ribonuclease toxin [Rhizobacter sp. OV335]SHN25708.1 toxin-antitoxin system PIN domain toxin [Rhizobacter sp. OV335]
MTVYLLDVNVLIALVDPEHIQHDQAHDWFARVGRKAFATCPLTENGLIRIIGHPKYPNSPGPPSTALQSLVAIRSLAGHKFWPDDLSIADEEFFAPELLSSHSRVTDSYLLALAYAHGGRLATMDQKLATEVVPGGKKALELIRI